MSSFSREIKVHLSYVIFGALVIATLVIGAMFIRGPIGSKVNLLLGGLTTGLVVLIIQYLFDWNEHLEIENVKKLKIRRILKSRDDEAFYRKLLSDAKHEVWVMGVTALRFMQDFADEERGRVDKRVLTDRLQQNVTVKILVPKEEFLVKRDQDKLVQSRKYFQAVAAKYGNFKVRYMNHIAAHSIVRVDDQCLLGPIFPHVQSQDSPCIHTTDDGEYAKEYLKYFEHEWEAGKDD